MSLEEAQQDLSDPQLAPIRLQQIAGEFPQLRPQIALHPQAYPALLEWLQNLGDADVDKALRRRRLFEKQGATAQEEPAGPDPDESTLEQEPENMPATPAEDDTDQAQAPAEDESHTEPSPQIEEQNDQPEGQSAAELAGSSGQGEADSEEEVYHGEHVAANSSAVTGEEAPSISYTSAYGSGRQNPEETVVIPKFEQERMKREYQPAPASGTSAPAAKKKSKAVPILATLLALALVVLVASGILLFKNRGKRPAPAATPTQSETTQAAPETKSSEPTESDSPSWDDPAKAPYPVSGQYVETGAFVMPSGNIACKLEGDGVSCTVYQNDYRRAGVENCGDGKATLAVEGDAAAVLRCGTDAQTSSTRPLDYGQTAFKDKVACSATQDGVQCWNLDSGKSFFANRQGWSRGSDGRDQ